MEMEVTFPGGKKVDVSFRGFTVHTDQSPKVGGDDSYPSPFELFFASIATCAGYYVINFCQERKIPEEGIKVRLLAEKNVETKKIDKVSLEIQLPPKFPEKYTKAVVRAAELCSVKKLIETPPSFDTYTTTLRG